MNRIYLTLLFVLFSSSILKAQWLLNFGGAQTLDPGHVAFISGTGAQFTFIKEPSSSTNLTPFLAHAGIRVGLLPGLDIGYRLCSIALPYTTVGPTLGSAIDLKLRLTPASAHWQFSLIGGGGYAFVEIAGQSRSAWSPGGVLVLTKVISPSTSLTLNGRFSQTDFSTLPGGSVGNYVRAIGGSAGASFVISPALSILPEIGVFDLKGSINNVNTNGIGLQIGSVIKVDWGKAAKK
jgi:hypothetical protein